MFTITIDLYTKMNSVIHGIQSPMFHDVIQHCTAMQVYNFRQDVQHETDVNAEFPTLPQYWHNIQVIKE